MLPLIRSRFVTLNNFEIPVSRRSDCQRGKAMTISVNQWVSYAKKNGLIIDVGPDYLFDDGRIILRGYYGRGTTIWVDVENGVYYDSLYRAYDERDEKSLATAMRKRMIWGIKR